MKWCRDAECQKKHRANMDMMNKQLAQLASSMNEMKGNSGKLPSTVHIPEKTNVSKITLRSGTAYNGPQLKKPMGEPSKMEALGDTISQEELKRPLPQMEDPFFLEEEPAMKEGTKDVQPGREGPEETKGEKPFPYHS